MHSLMYARACTRLMVGDLRGLTHHHYSCCACNADDGSSVQVWGDERQRVSILIQGILPWAMLAPEACIERLTLDALTQTGQVAAALL